MDPVFLINSAALGVGLAMDAFSVSMANGLHEPEMGLRRMGAIAGVYGFFQYAMPMVGWICVHTVVRLFRSLDRFIPWIALILLLYIGGKMLLESWRERNMIAGDEGKAAHRLSGPDLLLQGVATSIDALSVGFTIAHYSAVRANLSALIIALVTFMICMGGLFIGKKIGTRLSAKAGVLGGCILIFIGIEIFVRGVVLHLS